MQPTTIIPKKGIDFVSNSKKPYPDWIKHHRIFKELPTLNKVFPRIGLSNFKEPCEIMNSEEATKCAKALGIKLTAEIVTITNALYANLDKLASSKDPDRETSCAKLQEVINLYLAISRSLGAQYTNSDGTPAFISVKDGKTTLTLRCRHLWRERKQAGFQKRRSSLSCAE